MPQSGPILNLPETPYGLNRRQWLGGALAGAVAAALRPQETQLLAAGPSPADEAAWSRVRQRFVLRDGLTMVNAANLCPAPTAVLKRYVELTRDVDRDPSSQNRSKFRELRQASREAIAAHLGAQPREIALVRNTSEANNTVVAGLDLKPGDEVVVWSQNHPTNNLSWEIRAKRHGIVVRKIETPAGPSTAADLIEPFLNAFTGRTQALAVTHVSNLTGVQLPVRQLCAAARERGAVTIVDGAQTFGSLKVDVREMGCDFFTGSAHKWFMGPREAGVLYVAAEHIERLWPLSVGIGYEGALERGAEKFETLGQRDDAALAAMKETAEFHRGLGLTAIENRIRALVNELYMRLEALPGIRIHTPSNPELRAGVVVFKPRDVDVRQAVARLYSEHDVGCAGMSAPFEGIRFSPHVYNSMAEMERLAELVAGI